MFKKSTFKEKEIACCLFRALCFVIAGMFIFKNTLFYSSDELKAFQIDENIMAAYENKDLYYSPLDETATILLSDFDFYANELIITFDSELEEDAVFTLFNSSSNVEQYVIDSQTVNSGKTLLKFKFDTMYLNQLKVSAISTDGTHFVDIPTGNVSIHNSYLNILQMNKNYIFTIISIIILSILLSLLIWKMDLKYGESYTISNKTERESNIEVLRILCMFFIILHHYAIHGGAVSMDYCSNKLVAYFFIPAGKICFNVFLAISMWFLVDQKFKVSRFLKMWMQVFFYSVSLTVIVLIITDSLSIKNLISSLLPIAGNSHGFAAAYLLFYLFFPFLQMLMDKLSKRKAMLFILLLFYAQLGSQIIGIINNYTQNFASEIGLFVFSFALSYYFKKWPPAFVNDKLFNLALFGGIYLLVFEANCMTNLWEHKADIFAWVLNLSNGESSILMIAAGYSLFFLVKNIKIKNYKFINKIATYTFGVLLIHDHNYFRTFFWDSIVNSKTWYYSSFYIVRVIIMGIVIFYVCSIIDYLREKIFERIIIKNYFFKIIEKKLEEKINEEDV